MIMSESAGSHTASAVDMCHKGATGKQQASGTAARPISGLSGSAFRALPATLKDAGMLLTHCIHKEFPSTQKVLTAPAKP